MNKSQQLLQSIDELETPTFFHELVALKKDISTKAKALKALLDFIKKNKTGRFYLDTLNWLKRLTDKEYNKLYKQHT